MVCQRLIHMVLNVLHIAPEFLGGNQMSVVLHADLFAQPFRPADFVVFLSEIEAHRKGFLICEVGGNIAGVHAAGEKAAHLHIADLMGIDAFLKYLFNFIHRLFFRQAFIWVEPCFPIPGGLHLAVTVPQVVAGQ